MAVKMMKRTDIKHIDELGKAHISSKKRCSYPILKNYLYFCARIENITSYERYKTISKCGGCDQDRNSFVPTNKFTEFNAKSAITTIVFANHFISITCTLNGRKVIA